MFVVAILAALCALAFAQRLGRAVSFEVRLLHPLLFHHRSELAYILHVLYGVNEREFACPCHQGSLSSFDALRVLFPANVRPDTACTRSLSFRLDIRQLASVVDVQHALLGCDAGL